MPSNLKLPFVILAVSAGLGLLADALLRATPWGLNFSLWIFGLGGSLLIVRRLTGAALQRGSVWLMVVMAFFAACYSWRDSETLRQLDLMAVLLAAALVIARQSAPFWTPTVERIIQSAFQFVGHCVAGFVHLIARDIDWSARRSSVMAANARSATIGVLLAIPMLVVFTTLFVLADAAYEKFISDILTIRIAEHIFPIGIGTWVAGSFMRGALVTTLASPPALRQGFQLGATETNVCLGLLNALFATFVAIQTQYLFGDARLVETTPGMTYAGYARRGFFELCAVALLVLPILLAGDKWHNDAQSKRPFRTQSFILVAFVLCIMTSALHRMRLYQLTYGLTELRFYTVAFMLWLAFVFVIFCATILRDKKSPFAIGVLASGYASIFILHALNPDARIAATNLAHAHTPPSEVQWGRRVRFDGDYLRMLSADAVPVVLANSTKLSSVQLQSFMDRQRKRLDASADFRSWNYGRATAREALR